MKGKLVCIVLCLIIIFTAFSCGRSEDKKTEDFAKNADKITATVTYVDSYETISHTNARHAPSRQTHYDVYVSYKYNGIQHSGILPDIANKEIGSDIDIYVNHDNPYSIMYCYGGDSFKYYFFGFVVFLILVYASISDARAKKKKQLVQK